MFRIGQKVVCVRGLPSGNVITGRVYTISAINALEDYLFVGLVENKHCSGDPTPWFSKRFRPVVETKTDISIFTKMLKRSNVDA